MVRNLRTKALLDRKVWCDSLFMTQLRRGDLAGGERLRFCNTSIRIQSWQYTLSHGCWSLVSSYNLDAKNTVRICLLFLYLSLFFASQRTFPNFGIRLGCWCKEHSSDLLAVFPSFSLLLHFIKNASEAWNQTRILTQRTQFGFGCCLSTSLPRCFRPTNLTNESTEETRVSYPLTFFALF